jgi:hypothetical protein
VLPLLSPPTPTRESENQLGLVLTNSDCCHAVLWYASSGKEAARLVTSVDHKDWLVVTPEGLFDGTEVGRKMLAYRVDGQLKVVPADHKFESLFRPGVLQAILCGEQPKPDGDSNKH